MPIEITETEYADLCARSARIHHQHASVAIRRVRSHGTTERRFVMEGPSGTHSLLVDATDRNRLNAHWRNFCQDGRNRYSSPKD